MEASNVLEFDVSSDGRYVVWQDLEPTNDDPVWPAGAVYVLDRERREVRYLADAPLAGAMVSPLSFAEWGVVWLQLGYLDQNPARYWSLPEMTAVDLPLGQRAWYKLERLSEMKWEIRGRLA